MVGRRGHEVPVGAIEWRREAREGDDDLRRMIADLWGARTDRYSELRSGVTVNLPKVEMSYIGG